MTDPRPTESRVVPQALARPGDLFLWDPEDSDGPWWCAKCAGCGDEGSLHEHHHVVVAGAVPTVSPSLVWSCCGAHYFIHGGRIEWC